MGPGVRRDDIGDCAAMSVNSKPDEDVHLIVAQDEEVIIEHHPEDWIAFVLFWALAIIVFLQFFTRYIMNDSLSWTEEIARYGLMWVVFIGGAMVTRRNSHIAVELLAKLFTIVAYGWGVSIVILAIVQGAAGMIVWSNGILNLISVKGFMRVLEF